MPPDALGKFMIQRMTELDIPSQSALARKIGKSPSYVRQLINGINPSTGGPIVPSTETWDALARALRVTSDQLKRIRKGEDPQKVLAAPAAEAPGFVLPMGKHPPTDEERRIAAAAAELGIVSYSLKTPDFWSWPPEERRATFRNLENLIEEERRNMERMKHG